MGSFVQSIRAEYVRCKALAEGAIAQLTEAQLTVSGGEGRNSIATICWHVSGNLRSRFADFLTTDGEKPWRHRDEEFEERHVSRAELLVRWSEGWAVLFATLDALSDEQLGVTVTIRGQPLQVHEALHRSLAHTSYHVGQIVFVAKELRGAEWTSLSIPRGQSAAYNTSPTLERGPVSHPRTPSPDPRIVIRAARPDDAEAIASILNRAIETRLFSALDTPFSVEAERRFIESFPARGVFLVAVRQPDDRVVGFQNVEPFASYTHAFEHVGVIGTYVDLDCRREGIGRQLFSAMATAAARAGYRKLFTYIRVDNPVALAAYQQQGFTIVGIARAHAHIDGRDIDEIIVEKMLV